MTAGDAARARAAADVSAGASGVSIRPLHGAADAAAAIALFDSVWQPGAGERPISAELLVALAHSGNYVAGAYLDADLVGAAAGFLASPPGEAMHSHIAAVSAAARGRHVGMALKVDQRAWALEAGLSTITWTFDPLVRRNAAFNLRRLRAHAAEYLPDFYGVMTDSVNVGDASDRLLVAWPLDDEAVAAGCEGAPPAEPPAARPLLVAGPHGAPGRPGHGSPGPGETVPGGTGPGETVPGETVPGETVSVATPADVEALRRGQPELAREWRAAVRDTLGALMADGGEVLGLARDGSYVVRAAGGSAP